MTEPTPGPAGPTGPEGPPGPPGPARTPPNGLPGDDLVERTLERAAEKVAAVTVPGGPPIMNRNEAICAVALLVILNLAALFVNVWNLRDTKEHRNDFRVVCRILVERAPAEAAKDLATRLADCLK
jgi:hypothetical protein